MVQKRLITRRSLVALGAYCLSPAAGAAGERFFDSVGVRIRYIEEGWGEPVVLVHGYTSNVDAQWAQTGVLQALASRYRVIALDARGHGSSGKPHDPTQYGPEMGIDILRLLNHLDIARAHIVGYSMGAHIVAQLVTTHPERFLTVTRPVQLVLGRPAAGRARSGRDGAGPAPLPNPSALVTRRATTD
jgi:pimeloyl-ACP methyl ester carboxylesterase